MFFSARGIRADRVELIADGDADAALAVAGAEGAGEGHLILEVVLLDQGLEAFEHEVRALNMAGAAQTDRNGHRVFLPDCVK